jgi:hypothetical protein
MMNPPPPVRNTVDRDQMTVADCVLALDELRAASQYLMHQMALQSNRESEAGYNSLSSRYRAAFAQLAVASTALGIARMAVDGNPLFVPTTPSAQRSPELP